MIARPGSFELPAVLRTRHAGWTVSVAYQHAPPAITYRLQAGSGETRFVKLLSRGAYPGLRAEADRMRWAATRVSVPRVIEVGGDGDADWLLTEALPGSDATDAQWRSDPGRLVDLLAGVLRDLHTLDPGDCPFDFRLDASLAHARRRVEAGLVEPGRDFHEEFARHSARSALAHLEEHRPPSEDLVVCHGDFCLPNVMVEDWSPTGILDLGELGVADRWWDLAVATWSLTWNLGPGFEERFLRAYGVDRDEPRVQYYRLLYDVVS